MLQAINDRSKGIVGGVIVFFLSITFASWGIQEYLTGRKEKNAASVNGAQITAREYEDAVAKQHQRYQSIFGANMPTDAAFEHKMKQQVLDQLVAQRVMNQTVEAENYRIPNKLLAEKVHGLEYFQSEGKFSNASFQQILRSQNLSSAEFEKLYRRELMVAQLHDGISKSIVVSGKTVEIYEQLQQQTRNVNYVLFNASKELPGITLTADDVQNYFTQNQSRYQYPEQASISYLELTADDVQAATKFDEADLHHRYDEYLASLGGRTERKARHLLIKLDAAASAETKEQAKKKIADIQQQLKSGKSFAALATQYSDDTLSAKQGGDLGWIAKGMTDPAFESALSALSVKGAMSDIVQTGFGYHLIQLDDIKAPKADSFEAKKAELVKAAQQTENDNLFYDKSEQLATLVYENDQTLQVAADALGLKIQNTGLFTRTGGPGVATNEAVRKAAFSDAVLKDGRNSEAIELAKNHILVLRVNQHQPVKPMQLEEVKPFVESALKTDKARQKIMAVGLQALADANAGKTLEVIAKEHNAELIKLGIIQRKQTTSDARIVQTAFSMAKPLANNPAYDTVETQNGIALIAVLDVASATATAKPEDIQAAASLIESDLGEQEMAAMLNYLKSESDIVLGKDPL